MDETLLFGRTILQHTIIGIYWMLTVAQCPVSTFARREVNSVIGETGFIFNQYDRHHQKIKVDFWDRLRALNRDVDTE